MADGDTHLKDPNATKDYGIDWASFLAGDTIQSSTWIVPAGLTSSNPSNTSTTTTVWLAGGTLGETYTVTNRVVTAGGRTEDQSLRFYIRDR